MPNSTLSPESPSQSPDQTEEWNPHSPQFSLVELLAAASRLGVVLVPSSDSSGAPEVYVQPGDTIDAHDEMIAVFRSEVEQYGPELNQALLTADKWRACIYFSYIRKMSYPDYLNTKHWKETRSFALDRVGRACQVCNSPNELEVHHRSYKRLGNERDDDLTVLCATCHQLFHDHGRLAK